MGRKGFARFFLPWLINIMLSCIPKSYLAKFQSENWYLFLQVFLVVFSLSSYVLCNYYIVPVVLYSS
jgi:hypothetical protein